MIRSLNRAFVMGVVSDIDGVRWYTVGPVELCSFAIVVESAGPDGAPGYVSIPVEAIGAQLVASLKEQALRAGDEVLVDGQLAMGDAGLLLCTMEVSIGRRNVGCPDWAAYDRQMDEEAAP